MAPVTRPRGTTIHSQIRINGISVIALVDTGASVSCINEQLYKRHRQEWGPLEKMPHGVQGADGRALNVGGITRTLEVTLSLIHI